MTMQLFGPDVLTLADRLTDAYVEVFTAPPWDHRDPATTRKAFRERLESDTQRPGFRAALSLSPDGEVDGFITGWITQDPFPADRAYGKVTRLLGSDRVDELLVGAFEIDELGVRAGARGTGLGRQLLATLAAPATVPGGRAWLLTWDQAHETLAFYRRMGWREPEPLPGHGTDVVVFLSSSGPASSTASSA